MKRGLVIGKFLPFHLGHKRLIEFGAKHCDQLTVMVCASDKESVDGATRLNWLLNCFQANHQIKPILFAYNEADLPNTSMSSKEVSKVWSEAIIAQFGAFDVIISSEHYGDYVAEYMNGKHIVYDSLRKETPISATQILKHPFQFWGYIAQEAQPYFVKKVVILGTESTGKSTLTAALAQHFETVYVAEMARQVIEKTNHVKHHHLLDIALLHAQTIVEQAKKANKILFIDTDLNITRSYANFLFGQPLEVPNWVEDANLGHLYFYISPDTPFIQDGTRLDFHDRNLLALSHLEQLKLQNITYQTLSGTYSQIFDQAVGFTKQSLFENKFA